jgi:hypothetical protein
LSSIESFVQGLEAHEAEKVATRMQANASSAQRRAQKAARVLSEREAEAARNSNDGKQNQEEGMDGKWKSKKKKGKKKKQAAAESE